MRRTWVMIASAMLLGLTSFAIQHSAARPEALVESVQNFEKVRVIFEVLSEPIKFSKSQNYSVSVKIQTAEIKGESVSLSANGSLRGDNQIADLEPRASYSCLMALSPTSLGERSGFNSRCSDEPTLVRPAPAASTIVANMRNAFMENLRGVDSNSAGLVAGLAIGDVSQLDEELKENMKLVSLTHLTAVSGANCAIVLAMFYLLVRQMGGGRWWRLGVGLAALLGYVALVGPQPSVLRAAVMAGCILVGISLGRKTSPMSGLAIAVVILLVADPWLAVDFGFALSVAATAGLLALTEPIVRRLTKHMPLGLAIALAVSLSAQIFCLPILLQLQGGLATYSLPANILADPLVAPITVFGILACLVAWIFPFLAWVFSYLASAAAWLIVRVADYFANQDNVILAWPAGLSGTLLAGCIIIGFLLWLRAEPTKLRNLGLVILAVISAFSVGSIGFNLTRNAAWPLSDWQVVACDVGQGDALVVRSEGKVAVVDVGKDNRLIDECLQRLKIDRIDLLVLTHFDMDHIGGLGGALSGRQVGIALTSPFKDARWGATGTNTMLSEAGIQVVNVEKGTTGNLGSISWEVLSPNRNAAGAEDSNDASIGMLWKSKEFNLVTMADLGEKGQLRMSANQGWWRDPQLHQIPLVLKVAHHGSADQYGELIQALKPDLSLISAGKNNSYGHPTQRTLSLLESTGSSIQRTDEQGSIAFTAREGNLVISNAPRS